MCMTSITFVRGVIAAAICSTYDAVLVTGVSIFTALEHDAVATLALPPRVLHARIVLRREDDLVAALRGRCRRSSSRWPPTRCA